MQFEMIIIILLIAIGFMVYYYLTDMSHKFNDTNNVIVEKVEEQFEDLNNKMCEMEESLKKRMFECDKRVKDYFSAQNHIHEANAINLQTKNNQFRYFDENGGNIHIEHIINSAENSCSPPVNMNGMYFIAKTIIGKNDDDLYMSSNGGSNRVASVKNNNDRVEIINDDAVKENVEVEQVSNID